MKYGILWRIKQFWLLLLLISALAIAIPMYSISLKKMKIPSDRYVCKKALVEFKKAARRVKQGFLNLFNRNANEEWWDAWTTKFKRETQFIRFAATILKS